jgi:hypothetical protein
MSEARVERKNKHSNFSAIANGAENETLPTQLCFPSKRQLDKHITTFYDRKKKFSVFMQIRGSFWSES